VGAGAADLGEGEIFGFEAAVCAFAAGAKAAIAARTNPGIRARDAFKTLDVKSMRNTFLLQEMNKHFV